MTDATSTLLPLRTPDTTSRATMTRRAWWLIVVGFVIPGAAQVLAGSKKLGRIGLLATLVLWASALVALALYLVFPAAIYAIATSGPALTILQGVLLVYAALWLVLTLDALRLTRLVKVRPKARQWLAFATAALLVVSVGTAGYGSYLLGVTRDLFSNIFGDGVTADAVDGRYNILLLGGDAGDDRAGMRPDSISLVSIDTESGAATIIGLPRILENVPFAEASPMYELYPDGYREGECNVDRCLLNSIYTEVELKSPELYPDAVANGSSPGIDAMKDAVSGILDVPIQYYALIDMQGFAAMIDALGGIDVDYTGEENLPFGGTLDDDGELVGVNAWLTPGEHHLDGNNALAYARSRYGPGNDDYHRMLRQREVQEAVLTQFGPLNVLTKFKSIADAGSGVVETDLPQGALATFVQLALKARSQPIATVELVPPDVDPEDPDYDLIREMAAAALR